MNKEELFLKYIDDQLTPEEKHKVESMLAGDETDRLLFEKVKTKKEDVLKELDFLNPNEPFEIPRFITPISKSPTKNIYKLKLWHYAAIAAILIGIYFGINQITTKKDKTTVDLASTDEQTSKTKYKELDCYISPNRCWNQRQLVWTFIEIKP